MTQAEKPEGQKTSPVFRQALSQEAHTAIGSAIEAYALVEGQLTSLLKSLLKTDWQTAAIIAFSVRTVHARCEMIGMLLGHIYDDKLNKYWESCTKFLDKLAKFRNAIAHWHPYVDLYEQDGTDKLFVKHVLKHPVPGKLFQSLSAEDVKPFIEDCEYIRNQLDDLDRHVLRKSGPAPLSERFGRPLGRPNLAVLRKLQSLGTRR